MLDWKIETQSAQYVDKIAIIGSPKAADVLDK